MAAVIDRFYGTGRRKTSVARVWIRPGSGRIVVNRRAFEDYFPRETLRMIIAQPFEVTSTAGPVRRVRDRRRRRADRARPAPCATGWPGRSRASTRSFGSRSRRPGSSPAIPRMRERKKYGQPGARQKFQYSKR